MSEATVHRLLFAMVVSLSSIGCSGSDLATVKGKVMYNDKPVTAGTVTFAAADKPSAYGELQPDGTYELTTDKPGDGATPGTYKVIVVAMEAPTDVLPEQRGALPPPTVPNKYTSFATTDLTADVQPGKENEINFNLTGSLGR